MASSVDAIMQDMLPELEAFEKRGMFNKGEIHAIVARRKNFEYQLHRRAALKQDFLRAVEYEQKLDQLRQLRLKAQREQKVAGKAGKRTLADVAIVRRIHFLFRRATSKYKSDLKLWMRWLDFCKESQSWKQLSKVITQAIHLHSTVSALWIEAAAWDFGHNANVAAARTLMQQGLRACKDDEQMWVEYFRMELMYVHKLLARRSVLGLTGPAADASDAAAGPNPLESATAEVLAGGVARVVLRSALAAHPTSLAFRRKLLDALRPFSFAGVERMRGMLYDSLASGVFLQMEDAWDLRARQYAGQQYDTSRHQRCCAVYDAALAALPTAAMQHRYAAYLADLLQPVLDHDATAATASDATAGASMDVDPEAEVELGAQLGAELLSRLRSAHAAGQASDALYAMWSTWAERLGQPKLALKALRLGCAALPASALLWRLRLEAERRLRCSQPVTLCSLIQTAVASVPPAEQADIWTQGLAALQADGAGGELQQLCDLLATSLLRAPKGPVTGGLGKVAAAYLQALCAAQGVKAARRFYKRLLQGPPPGGDFFRAAIALEVDASAGKQQQQRLAGATSAAATAPLPGASHVSLTDPNVAGGSGGGEGVTDAEVAAAAAGGGSGSSGDDAAVIALYEAAVAAYGDVDAALWSDYAEHQTLRGRGAGDVHRRATRCLVDPQEFVAAHRHRLGHTA